MNNTVLHFFGNSKSLAISMFMMLLLSGCFEESESEKQQKDSDLKIKKYIDNNNIPAIKANNGLYYEMLVENSTGQEPKAGEVMVVKYEMQTLEGKLLETHTSDSTLVRFAGNTVIPIGFNYGIDIMKKGEKIRCYIPSYLAYDSFSGKDEFGPNTNFILEIELMDITTEEKVNETQIDIIEAFITTEDLGEITPTTSGLYFKTLESSGGEEAKVYHSVSLHYKRKYLDGTLIQETTEDKPLVVDLSTNQLVSGFREGVLKMRVGEKALLILPSAIAFGASQKIIPNSVREELWKEGYISTLVDPYQIVQYEVELIELK